MTDKYLIFALTYIGINVFLIVGYFSLTSRKLFSRPNWLLCIGLVFMAIAASEKYFFGLLKAEINLGDIEPAILFLEVSVAALGGNLVASAFMSKAQISHIEWKVGQLDMLATAQGRLANLNRRLVVHRLRLKKQANQFDTGLEALYDEIQNQEDKIERIQRALKTDGKL